jgi:predicted dehydrogenase
MSGKLKAAVVGCGVIAEWHVGRLKDMEDIELVGFYDILKQKTENIVKLAGSGKAFDCYISMLDESKPDILFVCVPPDQHGMIELEAIKRGIHLLVQKPISNDIAVADKICDMATQHNIIISVGHQDRYLEVCDMMREFLTGREVGLVNGAWVGGIYPVYWWTRKPMSGGQIVEQNVHLFDMLRYLIGEPMSVYTAAGKGINKPFEACPGYDIEDYSATNVIFRNGTVANIFTGNYIQKGGGMTSGFTFFAKDATIDYHLRHKLVFTDKNGVKEFPTKTDAGMALDRTFIEAVKSGKPEDIAKIRSPYYDSIKTIKFVLAANKSIETGEAVYLNL